MNAENRIPAPDVFTSDGLNAVAGYVDRLLAAQKQAAVLMISSWDGISALTVLYMPALRKVRFNFVANWSRSDPQEKQAQSYFANAGIAIEENLSGEQRILSFWAETDPSCLTRTATDLLTNLYAIMPQDGLKFRYEERDL